LAIEEDQISKGELQIHLLWKFTLVIPGKLFGILFYSFACIGLNKRVPCKQIWHRTLASSRAIVLALHGGKTSGDETAV
jgi:hypothetical protein